MPLVSCSFDLICRAGQLLRGDAEIVGDGLKGTRSRIQTGAVFSLGHQVAQRVTIAGVQIVEVRIRSPDRTWYRAATGGG